MGIFATNSLPSNIFFCGNDKLNCEKVKGKRGRAGETRWNQSKNIDKMNNAAGYLKTQNEKCTHTHTHFSHFKWKKTVDVIRVESRQILYFLWISSRLPIFWISHHFSTSLSLNESISLSPSSTASFSSLAISMRFRFRVSVFTSFFLRGNASVRRIHVWYDWITLKRVNGLKCQSWTETFQYVPATTV